MSKDGLGKEKLEAIRALFTYYWKMNFDFGIVRSSEKFADDIRSTGIIGYVSREMLIAHFLVGKFYTGEPCTEEDWEYAKKYLLREEQ